jgi:hypothetical protein
VSRMVRRSTALAIVLVLAVAQAAFAAVTWDGARTTVPGDYSWNYSNSLEYTGTPGTSNFKLHDVYISDASVPEAAQYTTSADGVTWSMAKKISGSANVDGTSIATAGTSVIVGWQTGYNYYDGNYDTTLPRRAQVNISTNSGSTWSGVTSLTGKSGKVDYPMVAAAVTSGGLTNLYAAWVDSKACTVVFRQSSNGGAWSAPISIGTTTAKAEGNAYGCAGYANIAATRDLIAVGYVADDTGTLKVASINLNGNATRATTAGNWSSTTLADKISLTQNGFPFAAASPLNTGVVTVAYNTATAQRYVRYNGTSVSAPATIFANGTVGGKAYRGGYSTLVEPAPDGGYVAMWAGCRDVGITNACNYASAKAKFDLLAATSTNGTTWSTPSQLALSSTSAQLNDEPSAVVVPGTTGVKIYSQYNAYKSTYHYYDVWGWNGSGTL